MDLDFETYQDESICLGQAYLLIYRHSHRFESVQLNSQTMLHSLCTSLFGILY